MFGTEKGIRETKLLTLISKIFKKAITYFGGNTKIASQRLCNKTL